MIKSTRFLSTILLILFVLWSNISSAQSQLALSPETLWDVDRLMNMPVNVTYGNSLEQENCVLHEIWYDAEPYHGKPTRVFAWLGIPKSENADDVDKTHPAVLLIHGGGGQAFQEWAALWANRGYVALAMDLAGCGPDGKPHEAAGPGQGHDTKLHYDFDRTNPEDIRNVWTYHAISDILIGHALLAGRADVNPDHIAATGISWGGYLTCILAAVDPKLAAAVPVYGCGFLHENSCWIPDFEAMSDQKKQDWVALFDPSSYLAGVKCPILFVNGTNDFAYPLDSYQKSYTRVMANNRDVSLAVEINRPHSHIWTFPEVDVFIDTYCRPGKTPPLPKLGYEETIGTQGDRYSIAVSVVNNIPIKSAVLCYTHDTGPWKDRSWSILPAEIQGNTITAFWPSEKAVVFYLLLTDESGRNVSSQHYEYRNYAIPGRLPQSWQQSWENPPAEMRPLQIVHGYFRDDVSYYSEKCGLGGVVCNVGPKDYLRNESEWKRFVEFVRKAKDAGLRIWIYDENGYPSPMAGGLVLEGHPEFECLALVYDPEAEKPFYTRRAYEFTHASNNFSAMRRYPNLLDLAATKRFLEVTHEAYRDRLGDELFEYVEAFFTDEPSLNAVNIGLMPEKVLSKVFIADPIDPDLKALPMVPWMTDLPERYREKYGEEIMSVCKSLFTGDSETDKKIRLQYWTLVAELHAERYYGTIEKWCHDHGATFPTKDQIDVPLKLASSGHTLHEEFLISHVPLDGNKLSVLAKMDVPGLDKLNSNPRAWYWNGWMAAAYPCSTAILEGKRLVMTEVSDFVQQMNEESGPVSLSMMQAVAAWQASWGVTEFALYYGVTEREGNRLDPEAGNIEQMLEKEPLVSDGNLAEKAHSAYSAFVGRLNSVLREAVPVRPIMLYYPIRDLQEEYLPMADAVSLDGQTAKSKMISDSYGNLGRTLMASQLPFVVVDDHYLAENAENADYHGIVIPNGVEQTDQMKIALEKIISRGGVVLNDSGENALNGNDLKHELIDRFSMAKLEPASQWVTLGTFCRDNHEIHILTNTGEEAYEGKFLVHLENWLILDPHTGKITKLRGNSLPVKLKPHQTVILVQNREK